MSWFGAGWKKRVPIAVNNLSGAATIDVTAALPADHGSIWTDTQADGDDLYLVDADGKTKLNYNLETWSQANKTGTMEADNYAAPSTDAIVLLWLYYSNATVASGAAAGFDPVSAKTGTISVACADPAAAAAPIIRYAPERPGDKKPRNVVTKKSGETLFVWLDIDALLGRRCETYAGSDRLEEIDYVTFKITTGGNVQAGMVDQTKTIFADPAMVRVLVKAGTDGTDYTGVLTVGTTEGRIFEARFLLLVRDVDEA